MKLDLIIVLRAEDFRLELQQDGRMLDLQTAKYYHDLSDVLITNLDKLLKRNNIDVKSLKSYKIHSDLGQDSTSYKIIAAFVAGIQI
ncbi:MAG: hypothetical protein HYT61_00640 [Candidatus Yanofskybacteria bacterium]|nr:hypothetical protein [Candidatus Yanofskybacteria bacterium]